jgi:phosphoribosylanthranilate isomerase
MRVKICGVRTRADVAAAAGAGAAYVGLVFFDRSPRTLTVGDARWIAGSVPDDVARVVLTVDATDEALDVLVEAFPFELFQLHGRETPERVNAVRERYKLPVMKAVGVRGPEDLDALREYERAADQLLVDARPPRDAVLPGGNGLAFDWRLIQGRRWRTPWMLAGGLTPENVGEAVRLTGAEQLDVSSGVERHPGDKDHERVEAFVRAAHGNQPPTPITQRVR